MKKVYEAFGKDKEDILDANNDIKAFDKARAKDVGIRDLLMITRTRNVPEKGIVNGIWSINGIAPSKNADEDILIFDPLFQHLTDGISTVGRNNTSFETPIKLSEKAVILIPLKKYIKLGAYQETRRTLKGLPIRLYEGKEDLAIKMVMLDAGFVVLAQDQEGYVIDEENHPDRVAFTRIVESGLEKINEQVVEGELVKPFIARKKEIKLKPKGESIDKQLGNYRMITGLTYDVEGDISIDDELMASTDIGKKRGNQEDAVLLIRDRQNPDFKMMVVADGMGGHSSGEVASDIIVNRLKSWFESLPRYKKACFETSVEGLKDDLIDEIELKIQPAVSAETWEQGGSTLVCALIGKNDTLIANVGDSRAYIAKKGKIIQLSREDTIAQKHLEQGIVPTKEAARFDHESNILMQSIGMDRRKLIHPHTQVINNSDYDLLLLFTDGVTDCLSDEDIVAVCKTSDKKELASKIVEKAIRHDSVIPDEYVDNVELSQYIPGGKDNATAAVYAPKKVKGRGRDD